MNEFIEIAWKEAKKCPAPYQFGAAITKDGNLVASGRARVAETRDPSCHAEVDAIRNAAKALNNPDLSDCVLWASHEPCIMCLSSAAWAGIKEVYFDIPKEGAPEEFYMSKLSSEELVQTFRNKVKVERVSS